MKRSKHSSDVTAVISQNFGIRIIAIPAGPCPVKLYGSDPASVKIWIEELLTHGQQQQCSYQLSAIRYWVREFYPIGSAEYDEVGQIFNRLEHRNEAGEATHEQ